MLRDRVAAELSGAELRIPAAVTEDELLLVHTRAYVDAVLQGTLDDAAVRRIGFPWSVEMVERSRRSCGATVAAARAALVDGRAVYLAGGTHHAAADSGSGYCVFNDVAVAARVVQHEATLPGARVPRILIVDTDVHQGDGTASIFRGDETVFTLSVHGERNFPLRKQVSDLDIALPDGTTDDTFVAAVHSGLEGALTRTSPDFVLYLAGADPHEDDALGRLNVGFAGLDARDDLVFSTCERLGLPMAVCMGGGYARDIRNSVEVAFRTVRRALRAPDQPSLARTLSLRAASASGDDDGRP